MIVVDPNKAPRVYTETEQRDIAFLARLYAMDAAYAEWVRKTRRIPGQPPEGSRGQFAKRVP